MAGLDTYEWSLSRSESEARDGYAYRRIFRIPVAKVNAAMQEVRKGDLYPGQTGKLAPAVSRWELDRDWAENPGYSQLTLWYTTPNWEQWLEQHYSKGVLQTRGSVSTERVRFSGGVQIEGADVSDPAGQSVWQIVQGDNVIYKPRGVFRVYAVVHSAGLYRDMFMPHLGKANRVIMPAFGSCSGRGTLLFWSLDFQPRSYPSPRDNKPLYTAQYEFLYNEDGWRQETVSRLFRMRGMRTGVVDEDGDALTGEYATHQALIPTTIERRGRLVSEFDFGGINYLLYQSWTAL